MPEKDFMPDDKGKAKRRLLVNPAELGLTGRIKKALLEQDMGITQRIKKAVEKTHDVNSALYMKKSHFIMVGILLFFVILFGYFAFKTKEVKFRFQFPNGDMLEEPVKISVLDFTKEMKLQDYPRQIIFNRYDIYGRDISDQDFIITDADGKRVQDPRSLLPGVYKLHLKKEGFKEVSIPLTISKTQVTVPVELEPLVEPKRELKLYLNDPLIGGDIEPDDIRIIKNNKSVKNVQIKPGPYGLLVEKAGYHSKEIELNIPENGIVREKITLDYKERAVKMIVDDGLSAKGYEPEVRADEIALIREGQRIQFQGHLMPGYYDVQVQRDGYYAFKDRIKVVAGGDLLTFALPLKPQDREIVVLPNYDVAPNDLKSDKAYLKDFYGSEKETIPITDGLKVKPGLYWVRVEKANYHPYSKKIEIQPSSKAFEVKAQLISVSKLILLQIRSDFDIEPSINPDELLFDMKIGKAGYVPIEWGRIKRPLPPEKKEIEVPVFLETIPRRVICELTCDITPGPIAPDLSTLTRIIDGKPADQATDLLKSGVEVKPARYMLLVQKMGFEEIREEQLIYPGVNPHVIQRELKAVRRPVLVKLDTNYEPGVEVKPDEMKLNDEPIESGSKQKPGTYTLMIRKEGYHPLEKIFKIEAGTEPIVVQEQLKAKPRRLMYDIKGDNLAKLDPDIVSFDGNSVRENTDIPVKKAYQIEIKKKGYNALKKSAAVEPSEKPYLLSEILSPLRRKVDLKLEASFPKGKDLMPPDTATLGKENITQDTQVKPDRYTLLITKSGYKPLNRTVDIVPDEVPYLIHEILVPKEREVRSEIDYDVNPEEPNLTHIIHVESEDGINKDVKPGDKIDPNKYKVDVTAEGYEKVTEEAMIFPSESSYTFKYTLKAKPRMVVLQITGDYPPGKPITPDKVLMNGEAFSDGMLQMSKNMKPGRYSLVIEKVGYHPCKKEILIPAGTKNFVIKEQLITMPRLVLYQLYDAEKKDKELIPDKITLGTEAITQNNSFKPGAYLFFARTQGYPDISENIEIEPGVEPYKIIRGLIASSRLIKYELTGDYNTDLLTPKEISLNGKLLEQEGSFAPGAYDLVVYVPGYERLLKRIDFGASRDPFVIREKLTSKKRKVNFKITGSYPEGIALKPRKVSFQEKEIMDGEEVKPRVGGYQVTIEKEGYMNATQNAVLEPSENAFDLIANLKARPRRLVFTIDSDYKPSQPLEVDAIQVDAKAYRSENLYEPGDHKVNISKAGYKTEEFDYTIPTGEGHVTIAKTLEALPRMVQVNVISGFNQESMTTFVEQCTLGGRPVAEGPYRPSGYELVIGHPGYFEIRDKVEVVPGNTTQEFTHTLMPKKRQVIPNLIFDVPPVPDSPEAIIRMQKKGKSDAFRVQKGDELETGEYTVTVEKEGYDTLNSLAVIQPAERPYEMSLEVSASTVEVIIDITYDIEPPQNLGPYTVTFTDKKLGAGRNITSGKRIKPGDYSLQIARPGYQFKEVKKDITILPGLKPFMIQEKLYAKPRFLSFEMMSGGILVKAIEVLVDNKEAKAQDAFPAGKEYKLTAKFKDHKSAQKKIFLPPGEAPFVVDLDLVKLQKFDFSISKRYYETAQGMLLDGIRYNVEFYADAEQIEPHHINREDETAAVINGTFYALKTTRSLKVVSAFYYDDTLVNTAKPASFRDLRRIDTPRLLEHLRELAKVNPILTLKRMARLLEDRQDKPKIESLPKEDRERLINVLRDLDLPGADQQEQRNQAIQKLR